MAHTHTTHPSVRDITIRLLGAGWWSGGVTIDPRGGEPCDGYMVGATGRGIVVEHHTPARVAADWVARTLLTLTPGECVGSWRDDDMLYLDVSTRVDSLSEALALAARTGELAVWDVANSREVRVPASIGE